MSETNGYTPSPYIGDGYDEVATIPAHTGRWPEVTLHYRCMTADEEQGVRDQMRAFPNKSRVRLFAELFATKIRGWNLKDRHGKDLPITPDTISGLSPQFYDVLHSYLDGTLPNDEGKKHLEAQVKN